MIAYPSFMPAPLVDYGYSNANNTIQSTMESGYVVQRSRFTGSRATPKVIFQFNYFQLAVWEGFVENSLSHGAVPFQIKLPDPANQALTLQTALIDMGNYEVVAVAAEEVWKVTTKLILQNKKSLSSSVIGLLTLFNGSGEDAVAFADLWHDIVHHTLPEDMID